MEVSAGLKCKPSGNRGENSAATNYLSLDEYPFTCKLCFFIEYQNTIVNHAYEMVPGIRDKGLGWSRASGESLSPG